MNTGKITYKNHNDRQSVNGLLEGIQNGICSQGFINGPNWLAAIQYESDVTESIQ